MSVREILNEKPEIDLQEIKEFFEKNLGTHCALEVAKARDIRGLWNEEDLFLTRKEDGEKTGIQISKETSNGRTIIIISVLNYEHSTETTRAWSPVVFLGKIKKVSFQRTPRIPNKSGAEDVYRYFIVITDMSDVNIRIDEISAVVYSPSFSC